MTFVNAECCPRVYALSVPAEQATVVAAAVIIVFIQYSMDGCRTKPTRA